MPALFEVSQEAAGRRIEMLLTRKELQSLTHRVRPSAQLRALRFMGIEARQRPDGTVAVLRTAVESSMGGDTATQNKTKPVEPDWKALDAALPPP